MTLYLKLHSFEGSPQLTSLQHNKYHLQLLIQGQRAKLYQLKKDKIRYVQLATIEQQWLALTINQRFLYIRLLAQDEPNIKEQTIATLQLRKQQLIQDNDLNNRHINKNHSSPVTCHYLLQKHKLNLQLRYNPLKNIIKSLTNNTALISTLSLLKQPSSQQQFNKSQIINRKYQPIVIDNQIKINNNNNDGQISPQQPSLQQQMYIGPCLNKNVFSLLDPSVKEQKYKIIQPSYQ